MQLELNKVYLTKCGGIVKITSLDYSYYMPYFGVIKNLAGQVIRPCSYNGSGMVYNYKQSDFDIIKELSNDLDIRKSR